MKLGIAKKVIWMEKTLLQHNNIEQNGVNYEAMNNQILHALFTICKMSKHTSIEKRVTPDIIGKTLKK